MATEEPIVAGEVRFRSLFENSSELILYQSEAGLMLDADPAFLALVEETKAQVLHRPYTDFLSPEAQSLLGRVLHDVNTSLVARNHQGLTTPVALAGVVQAVLRTLHPMLEQCGGTRHLEVAAGRRVRANRACLYAIFFNLLAKAIKHRASQRPLHVTLAATADPAAGATIVVADNGLGLDQDQAEAQVFGLYKRFHAQYSGRSLGLYLVKTYVESLGGRIAVSSRVDEGTPFSIQLPY